MSTFTSKELVVRSLLLILLTVSIVLMMVVTPLVPSISKAQEVSTVTVPPSPTSPSVSTTPVLVTFEENKGQFDPEVLFVAQTPSYVAFLTEDGITYSIPQPRSSDEFATLMFSEHTMPRPTLSPIKYNAFKMTFVEASVSRKAIGEIQQTTNDSYLRGSEDQWVVNVPSYARVRYQEIYPGIEMVFMGELEWLRYDFVIAPGAKPELIRLRFEWTEKLELDTNGDLLIHVGKDKEAIVLRQKAPVTYQEVDGVRQAVQSRFVLNGNIVSFDLGSYDASLPLVIDPYLSFSQAQSSTS